MVTFFFVRINIIKARKSPADLNENQQKKKHVQAGTDPRSLLWPPCVSRLARITRIYAHVLLYFPALKIAGRDPLFVF